jgi:hypothetical protein
MTSPLTSLIVFAIVFGGSLVGVFLRRRLPGPHISADSKDAVRVAMALVSTIVGMSLGLLVNSSKNFYDTQNAEIAQLAANTVLLDRLLAHYGPEAQYARNELRAALLDFSHLELPANGGLVAAKTEALLDTIHQLSPKNEAQRSGSRAAHW